MPFTGIQAPVAEREGPLKRNQKGGGNPGAIFGSASVPRVALTPMTLRLLATLALACLASTALFRPAPSRADDILDRVYS